MTEPVITAWKDRIHSVGGHQGAYAIRAVVNSILYQGRTCCQWAAYLRKICRRRERRMVCRVI
ncbi:transposase [Streptomyces sp. 3211]|uniref:transposase n=1 Tax=Streptomyces sp. 3211 TaxID=1964449 RepID=UPI0017F834FC|nr:transposase [Streptomyces sp. 3211]